MRDFCDEYIYPDAQVSTLGTYTLEFSQVSRSCTRRMESAHPTTFSRRWRKSINYPRLRLLTRLFRRELNIHAMRLGPGKHLQGRVLMNGLVKPEQVRNNTTRTSNLLTTIIEFVVRLFPRGTFNLLTYWNLADLDWFS